MWPGKMDQETTSSINHWTKLFSSWQLPFYYNNIYYFYLIKITHPITLNDRLISRHFLIFRFFTDQGLERHLLGSHGLVTSSMQEAANKGKDAGRCPVCGRVRCIFFYTLYFFTHRICCINLIITALINLFILCRYINGSCSTM